MSPVEAVLCVVIGCVLVVVAFAKKRFYARPALATATGKEIPRWQGQLFVGLFGVLAIVVGICQLVIIK